MPPFAATAAVAAWTVALPLTLALSGIFGSISMVAWICVLLPQLFANFKAQSADGLSMAFLIVWLLGDLTNLLGALFTNLAPTAIALPSYFCMADLVLICQCAYYNTLNARKKGGKYAIQSATDEVTEDSPLLRRQSSSLGLPGSHRRHDTHTESAAEPLTKVITGEDETEDSKPWLHNFLSLIGVIAVGLVGWYISYKAGAWDGREAAPEAPDESRTPLEIAGLALGYVSAVFYLCARVPQIIKNYREQSCEGLALLFFILSLTGNLTYGVSVIAYSQQKRYLLNALPFLIGSLGTIVEDSIIFVQFRLYSGNTKTTATTE